MINIQYFFAVKADCISFMFFLEFMVRCCFSHPKGTSVLFCNHLKRNISLFYPFFSLTPVVDPARGARAWVRIKGFVWLMQHTLLFGRFEVLKTSKAFFLKSTESRRIQFLDGSQPLMAIWISHLWLMYHTLFWNWIFEVLKTSKSILFDKRRGHKKHSF